MTRDRPPLLPAALARVGAGSAYTRALEETTMPPRKRRTDPDDFTPEADVAAEQGVNDDEITRYMRAEADAGTGLLPAQVWAEAMGHDAPDSAALLRVGIPPGQPVTWLLYDALRRSVTPEKGKA